MYESIRQQPGSDVQHGLHASVMQRRGRGSNKARTLTSGQRLTGAQRQVRMLVLVDLRRVDVDVDDARVGGEALQLARHAVIKAHTQRNQKVGLRGRRAGRIRGELARKLPAKSSDTATAGNSATAHSARGQLPQCHAYTVCGRTTAALAAHTAPNRRGAAHLVDGVVGQRGAGAHGARNTSQKKLWRIQRARQTALPKRTWSTE